MSNEQGWTVRAWLSAATRSRLWVVWLGILWLGACADDRVLIEPSGPSTTQVSQESDQELPITQPLGPLPIARAYSHTIREEFAAMARRIPGGFGGIFFDGDGVLNIILRDPGQQGAARAALERERLIQVRRRGPRGDEFDPARARIHQGAYAYDDLDAWYEQLLSALRITLPMSSISVRRNRILIGIGNEAQRPEVERAVRSAGIPSQAVLIELVPEVHRLSGLRSKHRPVPGGVQIQYKTAQENGTCTIGPNVIRLSQEGFLVNSHCTKRFGVVDWNDITHYWQHEVNRWYELQTVRHIGNEAIDPAVFPCIENPDHGCRNSDAALGLYNSSVSPDFGKIARPASRNTEVLSLDSNNPRFSITQAVPWSIDGEILEKVGRTTGWSGGQVVDGCVSVAVTSGGVVAGPTIRCSMIVTGVAGEGDSGAPVFRIISSTSVELRGMLWTGWQTDDQRCSWDPFANLIKCPFFVASNLGGIEVDLNPDGNAPLHYFPTPGGGGGGGSPGCHGDPNDPTCVQ